MLDYWFRLSRRGKGVLRMCDIDRMLFTERMVIKTPSVITMNHPGVRGRVDVRLQRTL